MNEIIPGSGIVFIPGVEISCYHRVKEFHVTAYGFDPGSTGLRRLLAANQKAMNKWFKQAYAGVMPVGAVLARCTF